MVPGGQSLSVWRELHRENLVRRFAEERPFSRVIGIGQVPENNRVRISLGIPITTASQRLAVWGESHRPHIKENFRPENGFPLLCREVPKDNAAIVSGARGQGRTITRKCQGD